MRSSRRIRGLAPHSLVPPVFLPPELKVDVLARLDKRDLKSVRLVSKEWSTLATGPLFDRVFFSCREVDLQVWEKVTGHPEIGGAVREVVYDGSLFTEDLSFKDYFEVLHDDVRAIVRKRKPDTAFDSADAQINKFVQDCKEKKQLVQVPMLYNAHKMDTFLVKGYHNYGKYAAFELRCFESGSLFNDLCVGLRSLPNLRSVVFNTTMWHYNLHESKAHGTTNPKTLRGPYSGSPLCRSWNPFHLRPSGWDRAYDVNDRHSLISSRFEMLTQGLSATNKKLISLQTEADGIGGGLPQQALTRSNLTDYQFWHFMNAYSGLRCLDIQVTTDNPDQREDLTVLPMLLQQTFGLRKLSLNLVKDFYGPYLSEGSSKYYHYDEIFPAVGVWPELAELSITGLAIGGWDLMKLILGRARIGKLGLHGIDLLDGTWEGVIQGMHRMSRLTDLTMWGSFTHRGGTLLRPSSPKAEYTEPYFLHLIESYVMYGGRHPCLSVGNDPESESDDDWETPYRWYLDMMPKKELDDMKLGAREIGLDVQHLNSIWK